MPQTDNLKINLLSQNQAQKEVTVNEALLILDIIQNNGIKDKDLAAPPSSPASGDAYIVAASPTGAWVNKAKSVAWYNQTWRFISPKEGFTFWVNDENKLYSYDGSQWVETYSEFQNLSKLGINATADNTNRLTVQSDATLFKANSNDIRVKISKAATSNIASLLLQNNSSARAEIGLLGGDDLEIKTSSDGSSFNQSMVIDKSNGNVDFKQNVNFTGNVTNFSIDKLTDVAITSAANDHFLIYNGTDWVNKSPSNSRTSLGLGTIATQAASSVAITGGAINGATIGGTTPANGTFLNGIFRQSGGTSEIDEVEISHNGTNGIINNKNGLLLLQNNGNISVVAESVASAVNYWIFTNSATGNRVVTRPTGTDSNIGAEYRTKGSAIHLFCSSDGSNNLFNMDPSSYNQSYIDIGTNTAGKGFRVKEGTNARMGSSTLSSGSVTVSNSSITETTRIFISQEGSSTGAVRISSRTAETGFTITSDNSSSNNIVQWLLVEPS